MLHKGLFGGRAALMLGASLMLMASVAEARQTTENEASKTAAAKLSLGKVVVSAGTEKVAIDTPQAVTTLDQDDIDDAQASTIGELLESAPGVSVQGGVSALGQGFNIRGLGTGLADSDSRILMQIDGVAKFYEQYRMGSFFSEPELYKRVEILRGPASSTLYGAGALAGVVNFTTKDASDFLQGDDRFAVRLKAGYESNGDGRTASVILAGKPTDSLELLAAYNDRDVGHYKDGDGETVTPSNAISTSYLLKARQTLGGNKHHALWGSYERWVSDSTQMYDQAEGFGTTPVRRKVDDKTAVLGYENDFNGSKLLDLHAQGSYAMSKAEQRETTFLSGVTYSEFSYETLQGRLENRSELTLGKDWKSYVFVGAQAYQQERRNPRTTTSGSVNHGATTHPEGDMSKYGLYAQAELIWADRLTITPGVRIDWTRLEPGQGVTTTAKVKDNGVSPKIAVMYALNDQVSLFGSIAHTVRMPVLDEIYSRTSATATNYSLNLKPEESDNYELGATLSLENLLRKNDVFRAKVTAFRNDVGNLITRASTTSAYYMNVGESRFTGVELEAEYAARFFFARLNLSTTEGKNRLTDAYLNTVPADEANMTVGYRWPLQGVTFAWKVEAAADQDEVSTASERTPGYVVHGATLSWKPPAGALAGVDLRLAVDNIGDRRFRRHLSAFNAEGRSVKVSVAKAF